VNASEEAIAVLAEHRLDRRAYSATALEQLSWCPYRFYLRAVLRLSPREEAEPLEQLDPISRGQLIHAVQFALLVRLREEGLLPVTDARIERARVLLDEVFAEVEARFFEELAPAIERVFRDAAADAKTDLLEWLLRASERPDWVPVGFELGFGLERSEDRDPASTEEPVRLAEGISLRGAIDLVEQRDGALRATDHKTGAARPPFGAVSGGKVLQPVLYALALEALYPEREVVGGRLYYCTAKGGFTERSVALDAHARESVRVLRDTADAFIEKGFLPAVPDEGACERCDYRVVCGPYEERRTRSKEKILQLGPLKKLRKQP
jgi:ATP-dependent helicase/DNAse subunit B